MLLCIHDIYPALSGESPVKSIALCTTREQRLMFATLAEDGTIESKFQLTSEQANQLLTTLGALDA